jgi:hypothetical protein
MRQKGRLRFDDTMDYGNLLDNDYRLVGYHKKETFDSKGDLILLEFFNSYNDEESAFKNLMIKETRVYERNLNTSLPVKRTTNITWYNDEGDVVLSKVDVIKIYSNKKGFVANKRARRNIIDNASMYFYGQLMNNDYSTSQANADDFEDLTNSESSKYIKGNIQPLISSVTNSTDESKSEYREYMTLGMRDEIINIINITLAE